MTGRLQNGRNGGLLPGAHNKEEPRGPWAAALASSSTVATSEILTSLAGCDFIDICAKVDEANETQVGNWRHNR